MKFAIHKLRFLIALALIFWCAGTGCMFVSYAHASVMSMTETQNSHSFAQSSGSAASGSMGRHACCKARHASTKSDDSGQRQIDRNDVANTPEEVTLPSAPTESGVMNCCPLKTGSMVISTRTQTNDNASPLTQDGLTNPFLTDSTSPPLAVPLRSPNQARAYLLGCSFLI